MRRCPAGYRAAPTGSWPPLILVTAPPILWLIPSPINMPPMISGTSCHELPTLLLLLLYLLLLLLLHLLLLSSISYSYFSSISCPHFSCISCSYFSSISCSYFSSISCPYFSSISISYFSSISCFYSVGQLAMGEH